MADSLCLVLIDILGQNSRPRVPPANRQAKKEEPTVIGRFSLIGTYLHIGTKLPSPCPWRFFLSGTYLHNGTKLPSPCPITYWDKTPVPVSLFENPPVIVNTQKTIPVSPLCSEEREGAGGRGKRVVKAAGKRTGKRKKKNRP